MLRGELLSALVSFGHEETIAEAKLRFEAFLEDRDTPLLPADIRKVIKPSLALVDSRCNYDHQSLLMIFIDELMTCSP
jgi:puromycin-sensitive aminopeptidase